MGRGKKGGGRKKMTSSQHSAGGTYVVDRLLIPRCDNYAANNSLDDIDAVADALRATFKEYQRRPMAPFKQMVQKAINAIQARSQVSKQNKEAAEHKAGRISKQGVSGAGNGSSLDGSDPEDSNGLGSQEDSSSESDSESDASFESGEGSGEAAASGAGQRAMNASLLSMYARPALPSEVDDSQRAGPGPSSTAHASALPASRHAARNQGHAAKGINNNTSSFIANGVHATGAGLEGLAPKAKVTGKRRRSSPQEGRGGSPPAFAPPEVVAAAACRALASEKQVRLNGITKMSSNTADQKIGLADIRPGSDGTGMSSGAKPFLVLPQSAEPPAGLEQQHASHHHQQQQLQQQQSQQPQAAQQQGHPGETGDSHQHRHHTVPPAEAGVATAVAAAMAAAAAAAASGKQGMNGQGGAEVREARAGEAMEEDVAGLEGDEEVGGDARVEDGREDRACKDPGMGRGQGNAAKTTAVKAGGGAGRPTSIKKAHRTGPTPAKPHTGGGSGRGGAQPSAVTIARAVTYADLGGVDDVLSEIRELIEYPLKHPEVYAWLGVEPPRGVLLHGPPGCGKTALANAIANECCVPFLRVSAPEIVSGMSGESEAKLRSLFQEAADVAPCIVFIDEIDAIAPKRETAQREMERRIVAQMLTCMDDLTAPPPASSDGGQQDARAAAPVCSKHVVVIGATNRPDALDPALRRAGRFDREIALGIPSEGARIKILQVITQCLRLEGNFDFKKVARQTPGFVGADLMALVKEAAALAVTRIFSSIDEPSPLQIAAQPLPSPHTEQQLQEQQQQQQQQAQLNTHDLHPQAPASAATPLSAAADCATTDMAVDGTAAGQAVSTALNARDAVALPDGFLQPQHQGPTPISSRRFGQGPLQAHELQGLAITMADFEVAVGKVQPSVRREGFATTPDVSWEDVGSLDEVREELSFCITQPIMHPERFQALGMSSATGVLLYGPPGCGKTLVAKAVAHESGANFMSIKGPELLNKYVGESERAVRQLFSRARAAHPCVLFFDELDALAPRRGTDSNQAAERVVNQLLTEMDGIDGRLGVFLVAATNRPDMIDPALLRPGRLDKILFVPLPPPDGRASILKALVRNTPLAPGVDIEAIGMNTRCSGFSGADMAALVREACVLALKESMRMAASAAATGNGRSGDNFGLGAEKPLCQCVHARHFEEALGRVVPSVSRKDQRCYDVLRNRLRSSRGRLEVAEDAGAGAATGGQNKSQTPAGGEDEIRGAGEDEDAGHQQDLPSGIGSRPMGPSNTHPVRDSDDGDRGSDPMSAL